VKFKFRLPDGMKCDFCDEYKLYGLAEREPGKHSKSSVTIDLRISGKDKLETIIHEVCHQLNWKWKEKKVTKQSECVAYVLWKMGYRLKSKLKKKRK
jgi:hypothetical protein